MKLDGSGPGRVRDTGGLQWLGAEDPWRQTGL